MEAKQKRNNSNNKNKYINYGQAEIFRATYTIIFNLSRPIKSTAAKFIKCFTLEHIFRSIFLLFFLFPYLQIGKCNRSLYIEQLAPGHRVLANGIATAS